MKTEPAPVDVQLHPLPRRILHWVNALAILIMIGSGWRIYDWYPALPWETGFPPAVTLGGGNDSLSEALHNEDGLANALAWHFGGLWLLLANFVVYLIYGFASGHFRADFLPIRPRAVLRDFTDALRFRLDHHLGQYNAVQKLLYVGVLLAVVLMLISGFAIWKPVQFHAFAWLLGGYETARVVHFFGMTAIVGFLVVHVALTILVPKTLVAMVTGKATARHAAQAPVLESEA